MGLLISWMGISLVGLGRSLGGCEEREWRGRVLYLSGVYIVKDMLLMVKR